MATTSIAANRFENEREQRARWRWRLAASVIDILRAHPNGLTSPQLRAKTGYRHKRQTICCAIYCARHYLGANIVTDNPHSPYSKYRLVA